LSGEIYLLSDDPVTNSPVHLAERGQLKKIQNSRVLTYDTTDFDNIPDGSLSLITIYIGIHHCPPEKMDDFMSTLYSKLRAGGVLIIRDHDAGTPIMKKMAGIAHDVFNV
jgi:predicted methyltransferase